jgi:hypothetical protein
VIGVLSQYNECLPGTCSKGVFYSDRSRLEKKGGSAHARSRLCLQALVLVCVSFVYRYLLTSGMYPQPGGGRCCKWAG